MRLDKDIFVGMLISALSVFLLLLLILGAVTFRNLFSKARFENVLALPHIQHDDVLGWTLKPGAKAGFSSAIQSRISVNSQGFRNDQETLPLPQQGNLRILCSGDSFTFGYGVDNGQTWCDQIQAMVPGVETVNLGVEGYGSDQSYLRYREIAGKYTHQIHLFALIANDLQRMSSAKFSGVYNKPFLELRNNQLVVTNYPVLKSSRFTVLFRSLANNTRRVMEELQLVSKRKDWLLASEEWEKIKPVFTAMIEDMVREAIKSSGRLYVIYIPVDWEALNPSVRLWLRTDLEKIARAKGAGFIDLTDAFSRTGSAEFAGYYIPSHKHLTPKGNEAAARIIVESIKGALP